MNTTLLTPQDLHRIGAALREFGAVTVITGCGADARATLLEAIQRQIPVGSGQPAQPDRSGQPNQPAKPAIDVIGLDEFRKIEQDPAEAAKRRFVLLDEAPLDTPRPGKVLLIGATSLLGNALHECFSREYRTVVGTGFSKAAEQGYEKVDAGSAAEIRDLLTRHADASVVIYIAGEANADIAEKERERTRAINTDVVRHIAQAYKGGRFVYISTEYVFDGGTGPYTSFSRVNPVNFYGRTKVEAEALTKELFSNALILRLGALYGFNHPGDKTTTVKGIIEALKANRPITVDNTQVKHPVLLEDVAATLLRLLDHGASGIYQSNGAVGYNKHELALRAARVWNEVSEKPYTAEITGKNLITGSDKPMNTQMVNVDTPRSFEEGLRHVLLKDGAAVR